MNPVPYTTKIRITALGDGSIKIKYSTQGIIIYLNEINTKVKTYKSVNSIFSGWMYTDDLKITILFESVAKERK